MRAPLRRSWAAVAAVAAVAACSSVTGQGAGEAPTSPDPTATAAPVSLLPLSEREPLCPPGGTQALARAEAVMADTYDLGPAPPTQLPRDIDWGADPFGSTNWQFNLHALRFLWELDAASSETGDPSYLARALEIARDWVEDNPREDPPSAFSWNDHSTAWRAMVFSCLYERSPQDWLAESLRLHLETLADPGFYVEHGNHALNQSIGLLQTACVLGEPDAATLAVARIDTLIGESIDEEGVNNEQSVEYQHYNFGRYDAARRALQDCGGEPSEGFAVLDRMPRFIAHATLPDGTFTTIGDTDRREVPPVPGTPAQFAATQGQTGPRPDATYAVFSEGFAFARSGWGDDRPFDRETHMSLRFGAPRRLHGHHDAGSVTLYSHGQQLVVDPGKYEYTSDDMRSYVISPMGHNLVMAGGCDDEDAIAQHQMSLEHQQAEDGLLHVTLAGTVPGCDDVSWERTVVFSEHGRYVVVIDELEGDGERTFSQRWHLETGAAVELLDDEVEARVGGAVLHLHSPVGSPSTRIVEGEDDPIDGWISLGYGEVVPAPVAVLEQRGDDVRFVTLLMPSGAQQQPLVRVEDGADGVRVETGLGARSETILVARDGSSVERRSDGDGSEEDT